MKFEMMTYERPKGIRVMAILHMALAFSGIIRISSDLGAMKNLRRLRPMEGTGYPAALTDAYDAYARIALKYELADILCAILLAGMLIYAGVMLFRDRQQGRTLSISYAIVSIALACGTTGWYVAAIYPKNVAYLELLHAANPAAASVIPIPSISPFFLGLVFRCLYPLWVWWYLCKDEVRGHFED